MMELATAKGFVDLAKGLLDPLREYAAWRRERKLRVASFCEKIAACLAKLADSAESQADIHLHCGELNSYMDALMELLEGVIPKERLETFSKILNAATIQKRLINELTEPNERKAGIGLIREAAGSFIGLANVLRV